MAWAMVHNYNETAKDDAFQWFAMLHSDIVPEEWWLDKLIDKAEKHGAAMMGVAMPIKDRRGVNSTAILSPDSPWERYCRLTQKQLWHESFPETFDLGMMVDALAALPAPLTVKAPRTALLANTGMMIVKLDRDWISQGVWFENHDAILRINGKWHTAVVPEDWYFSCQIAGAGGKVMVTRTVKATHYGVSGFPNTEQWGQDIDEECLRANKEVA